MLPGWSPKASVTLASYPVVIGWPRSIPGRELSMRLFASVLALATALLSAVAPAAAQTAICYNCPPEWADWASQLKSIKAATGISVPHDNKSAGQPLSQLIAEKARPVADVAYFGVTFGIQAKKEGVTAPYKPAFSNEIPAGPKDAGG